jgi:predicted GIY-YIG superfamily endonuclease
MNVAELYRHFDKLGTLLYVGISASTVRRLAQHKTKAGWFTAIARVEVEHFANRAAARQAEIKAIKRERPKYNLTHSVAPYPPTAQQTTQSGIDTVARRKKLPVSTHPGWNTIGDARSGLKLGYRKGARGGVWVGKLVISGARIETTLGSADDGADAGLTHANATAAVIAWAGKERTRLTAKIDYAPMSEMDLPATAAKKPLKRAPNGLLHKTNNVRSFHAST